MKNNFYISKIKIKNIRCFDSLEYSFDGKNEKIPFTLIVGDNATGKTCLLKSIAIGLCDESSAAGLMRESDEGYISRWAAEEDPAFIQINLRKKNDNHLYRIKTRIERISNRGNKFPFSLHERIRQSTNPKSSIFPWANIFICGYSAARGTIGSADVSEYSVINSVYNIFNYNEGLQNPELTIHRIIKFAGKSMENSVLTFLSKMILVESDEDINKSISISSAGIIVDGPWGKKMPLRDLADGFKSTILWLTDFLGWALSHNPNINKLEDISGIVIIDEIEQHLHAKWQRSIIKKLHYLFPRIQFIATTHSPIVVGGLSDLDEGDANLLLLSMDEEKKISLKKISSLVGMRYDQILTSEAFGLTISRDKTTENIINNLRRLYKHRDDAGRKGADFKKALAELKQRSLDTAETETQRQTLLELNKSMTEITKQLEEGPSDKN